MRKIFLRLTLIASASVALVGCSQLEKIGVHMPGTRAEYESSTSHRPLDIPPDLDSIAQTDRFNIPSRPQIVSANAESARQTMANGEAANAKGDNIVPKTTFAQLKRDGQIRYVHVNVTPEKVWPVMQDFWPSVGLEIKTQDARTGMMQTEWAENKANLPKDIIRRTIGKVFDFVYDTGERDQYRSRIERDGDGATNIYITHRQMVETIVGRDNETTMWQPGPSDPQLEAEMLARLANMLEIEFNPDMKPTEQKKVEELAAMKYEPIAKLVEGAGGVVGEILVDEPFDRAWRRVNLAIDRAGFNVIDRDRSKGVLLVKYLDSDYEARKKKEQGFFKNAFNNTTAIAPVEYQIRLMGDGKQTHVTVLSGKGKTDTTGVAPRILTVLADQIH